MKILYVEFSYFLCQLRLVNYAQHCSTILNANHQHRKMSITRRICVTVYTMGMINGHIRLSLIESKMLLDLRNKQSVDTSKDTKNRFLYTFFLLLFFRLLTVFFNRFLMIVSSSGGILQKSENKMLSGVEQILSPKLISDFSYRYWLSCT